jgi:hypothetical protein
MHVTKFANYDCKKKVTARIMQRTMSTWTSHKKMAQKKKPSPFTHATHSGF